MVAPIARDETVGGLQAVDDAPGGQPRRSDGILREQESADAGGSRSGDHRRGQQRAPIQG
ncbi:hypothetical protein ACFXG4_43210 [Nocardia sp. NPDC059246]|uniref:hypothetical protein n=1 Tax=unclassified Nocardia TaxID=2637762 RepID=UPI0036A5D521